MDVGNDQQRADRPFTIAGVGAPEGRDARLAGAAREARRLLEAVQEARASPPPTPEETLRLKTEWERLTRWSAGLLWGGGTDGEHLVADLMRRCRDELAALFAAADQEATRHDEAPV